MKKKLLNEEFIRMQKLAGLLKEEEDMDDELETLFFHHNAKILAQDNQNVVVDGMVDNKETPLLLTKQQYKAAIDEYNKDKQWYIDNYPEDEDPGYGTIAVSIDNEGTASNTNMFDMEVLDIRNISLVADLEYGLFIY